MQFAQVTQWPAEAIWEQVAPVLPGFTVEVLPEIDSTNTELMRRAKAGRGEPILLVADRQTAGRGRLGREWHELSERERVESKTTLPSLTFSLGMPLAPVDWSGMSLAVGLSIAQSLHADIGLKWPNDLWVNERKLAGILIETCAAGNIRYVVVGVGINIVKHTQNMISTTAPLRTAPAWLQELLPNISAPDALLCIAPNLIQTILNFSQQGFAPFQTQFNQRDVLLNRQVSVDGNNPNQQYKITGIAKGVNKKGELEIETSQGIITIHSSEVSVKPL